MAGREGIPTGVHVVLAREGDGAILLMRRAGTGFFDGLFSLPGGHVEAGESILTAARREAKEEIGIVVAAEALSFLGVVHRLSDTNRIDFFVQAACWAGEASICEPDKCDHLDWFSRDALPDNTVPYVRQALSQALDPARSWCIELGWI